MSRRRAGVGADPDPAEADCPRKEVDSFPPYGNAIFEAHSLSCELMSLDHRILVLGATGLTGRCIVAA